MPNVLRNPNPTKSSTILEPEPGVMDCYIAVTFAPVQGFIEKSRKLRDLYGASLILSYLTYRLVKEAEKSCQVLSPGLINIPKGMPNRILLRGEFSEQQARDALLTAWKQILKQCRSWVENHLPQYTYDWEEQWQHWGNYSWEIFRGEGKRPKTAMEDLEEQKLSRNWIALNWVGESSSLTGTDAIAHPGLGCKILDPRKALSAPERQAIKQFYTDLSLALETHPETQEEEDLEEEISLTTEVSDPEVQPEGKFLSDSERLSIPELVKRLVTRSDISQSLEMPFLGRSFKDIVRRPEDSNPNSDGQWTGWFMGDGDKVGDRLKEIAEEEGDQGLQEFSKAMRKWGKNFAKEFPKKKLGRIVYAGGDDFLGVIYSRNPKQSIPRQTIIDWLMELPQEWAKHEQAITLSLGFVWAASGVPQRDILQHCREAQERSKNLGRDRVTIRIVFNSGQYVQWTCPWHYLRILQQYQDREKGQNWSHVYQDLAYLKSRHSIDLSLTEQQEDLIDERIALALVKIYFQSEDEYLSLEREKIVGKDSSLELIFWINNLIEVGWQLCS